MTDLASPRSTGGGGGGGMAMPSTGDYVDLHELAKGWKAAIARAKDPATRFVCKWTSSRHFDVFSVLVLTEYMFHFISIEDTKHVLRMIVVTYRFIPPHLFEHRWKSPKHCWKHTPKQLH